MWTGRTRRTLLLAPLLAAGCASSAGVAGSIQRTALHGVVLEAPTCPVERNGHPCPPAPVRGAVVQARGGGATVSGSTDRGGRFRLRLPAGIYLITVTSAGTALPDEQSRVRVRVPHPGLVRLVVDSGIR